MLTLKNHINMVVLLIKIQSVIISCVLRPKYKVKMKKWKIFRCGIILLCEIIFLCEFIECGKTVDTPRHLVKSSQSANNPISHPSIPFAGKIDEAYNGILYEKINFEKATFIKEKNILFSGIPMKQHLNTI